MRQYLPVLCCLCLFGCAADEQQDLRAWMEEQAASMRGAVRPLPEIKPFTTVGYVASGLTEPFQLSRIEPVKAGRSDFRPDLDRRREPLEAYPLESLAMVGVLRQGRTVAALVMADRNLYQVKVGNYMGQNFGLISEITDAEITLKEIVQDSAGDWAERQSVLPLLEETGKGDRK